MVFGISKAVKKRQAGAEERKRKRDEKAEQRKKLKRIEERAKAAEVKRVDQAEYKATAKKAISRGKEKARGTRGTRGKDTLKKIGKAAKKEAGKWGVPDDKPKKKTSVDAVARVKKFNGVKYQLSSTHSTKKLAQKKANSFKKYGESVRIIKTQKGYSVYIK